MEIARLPWLFFLLLYLCSASRAQKPGSNMSGKNFTGNIPMELTKLTGLVELLLDGNFLTGPIPDFGECINLESIHIENNQLSGTLPSALADLPNLKELNVKNNKLSGVIPQELVDKHISFNYEGNAGLHMQRHGVNHNIIITICVVSRSGPKSSRCEAGTKSDGEASFKNTPQELSYTFLGYSQQDKKNILVYEFMHSGTLKEHLRGAAAWERTISWIKRLKIAENAARGIEYLHTGCSPTIIHRDLKSSNILLDKHMRAKVADFGLSKPTGDVSHVSSIVRGTVGYLDPEYYISQQLSEKSDINSFGVILLEIISGQEPISNERFAANFHNIVLWAKSYIDGGNIQAIIDPSLDDNYQLQSVWKISEIAMLCVKPQGVWRPSISLVLKEIQEAIAIEHGSWLAGDCSLAGNSPVSSLNLDSVDLPGSERNLSIPYAYSQLGLR